MSKNSLFRRQNGLFIAPFVPSPSPVVEYMLKLAGLKAGEVLFDMGAGDGRTVITAAKVFGARGVGIELREDLAKKAMNSIHESGLDDRVTIVNDDMFNVNLSAADVVYLYLTTSANERLKPKLERDLKAGARVVSHDYEVVGWRPEKIETFCENPPLGYPTHTIYLYRKP
jgi:protein-L-isoaspartate O-methyltransferase